MWMKTININYNYDDNNHKIWKRRGSKMICNDQKSNMSADLAYKNTVPY